MMLANYLFKSSLNWLMTQLFLHGVIIKSDQCTNTLQALPQQEMGKF